MNGKMNEPITYPFKIGAIIPDIVAISNLVRIRERIEIDIKIR